MKKLMGLAVALLLAVILPAAAAAEEAPAGRTWTVMVYMCGSNLESVYGAATADIQEMIDAGTRSDETGVLVMAGGAVSAGGSTYFRAGSTSVYEIASGRFRRLWESETPMNMGESDTLAWFLRYGRETRPARHYALILWDHGGGPLGGVCWDELFSMDYLTVGELTAALSAAGLPERLDWIGFDACLMSSAEVAAALSPFAEYMIASQETEPATGWDYAFLSGMAGDAGGAASGKRIVDAYFESLAGSKDILTMACVDLDKLRDALPLLGDFFAPIGERLTPDVFTRLSGLRMASVSFGKGMHGVGAGGYDLVDLGSLMSHYGGDRSGAADALKAAVVYSRSSEEGATGLSVYHPYANKEKYRQSWRSDYRKLDFSTGYVRYMDRFGTLLTGETAVDWRNLRTEDLGFDEDGSHQFALALTPEQRDSVVSSRLVILQNVRDGIRMNLAPVAVETAGLAEDGRLTARYRGRMLYAADAEENILAGPISFLLTEDSDYIAVLAHYTDYSGRPGAKPDTMVLYHCDAAGDTGNREILRRYVYDETAGIFTNRIAFSEKDFTDAGVVMFLRDLPDTDGALPGFMDWDGYEGYLERVIRPLTGWHFRMIDHRRPTGLYAMFEITDSQQNTWCSQPVRMMNPSEQAFEMTPDAVMSAGCTLRLSAALNEDDQVPQLKITFDLANGSGRKVAANVTQIVLNGERSIRNSLTLTGLEDGGSDRVTLSLNGEDLRGLETVTSLDFVLDIHEDGYSEEDPVLLPVHAEISGCDVSGFALPLPEPIAAVESDGLTWQLRALEQAEDGKISVLLYLYNGTDQPVDESGMLFIDGVWAQNDVYLTAQPHTACLTAFEAENRVTLSSRTLHVAGNSNLYLMSVDGLLERAGIDRISRLDLFRGMDGYAEGSGETVTFTLPEPVPLNAAGPAADAPLIMGAVSAELAGVYAADDGLALAVTFRNDSDRVVRISPDRPTLNGTALAFELYRPVMLPPHTRMTRFLALKTDVPSAAELSLVFRERNALSSEAVVRLPEAAVPGGTYLSADRLDVTPGAWAERVMALSETVRMPETAPASLRVTVTVPAEEAERVDWVNVAVCLLGEETVTDENGEERTLPATRSLVVASLAPDGANTYAVELSGLCLTANGQPLSITESIREGGGWELKCSSDLYYYQDPDSFRPTGQGLFWDGGFAMIADISLAIDCSSGRVVLVENRSELDNWADYRDDRTNYPVDEVALAAVETRVWLGTDRLANAYTIDYSDAVALPLDEGVVLALEPYDLTDDKLCLYYTLQYTDGTRKEWITDGLEAAGFTVHE